MADATTTNIMPWRRRAAWLLQVLDNPTLPPMTPTVAIALADRVNEQTLSAWPLQATLAERCRLTTRTVRTCLAAMEEAGHIATRYRGPKSPVITIIIHEARNEASTQKRNEASTHLNERVETERPKSGNWASKTCVQLIVTQATSPIEPRNEPKGPAPGIIPVSAPLRSLPSIRTTRHARTSNQRRTG